MGVTKEEVLQSAQELKPFNDTTTRLLAIMGDPTHSLHNLTELIQTDAVLSLRVLQHANRYCTHIERKIETIDEAIFFIGEATLTALILSREAHIYGELPGYSTNATSLWDHSLKTALYSHYFIEKIVQDRHLAKVAYTAGLIHDIGKILLSPHLPKEHSLLVDSPDFLEKEKELTGFTHTEAGQLIAKTWKLPRSLRQAITWHHAPSQANKRFQPLTYAVHLGDIASMITGTGTGIDSFSYLLDESYPEHIPIGEDDFSAAMLAVEAAYTATRSQLQL
ncbi:HDOD domain-containing protein [Chitinivibrio alkaliphilus]|uniref:Metal dependent phosphohydrolase n=1 Tax=Chitinivibrio alkaliphilus ACht1 TaxID=1313304 RepID=U7DCJ3_9BACT|nr:HDOD domain-containing protein [Chitinivibrio alkaliphilus]ERP32155.1 Metal dependent phosphohydrolase [Chitinivibrio alkaliphilus ACht1]